MGSILTLKPSSVWLVLFTSISLGVAPFVLSVSHVYFLIQNGQTWSNARAFCQAIYTDLAIVESNDDIVQIKNEAHRQQFQSSAWIGLFNDINSWRWSFGNELLGNMVGWSYGQPNNNGGNQACGAIIPGGWDDRPCADPNPFVCFDERNNGYVYISTKLTWSRAQSYCRQYYTDLASERNVTEFSVVQGTRLSNYTWFGLFRDTWKWIDQTNFSSISWTPGYPNNYWGNENCGYLINSQVVDDKCSSIKPFFCYSELKKQQVMRIRVKSNQDVNELKAAILDQIENIMKDNGMTEEVTVTWRVQPDGVEFYKEEKDQC